MVGTASSLTSVETKEKSLRAQDKSEIGTVIGTKYRTGLGALLGTRIFQFWCFFFHLAHSIVSALIADL